MQGLERPHAHQIYGHVTLTLAGQAVSVCPLDTPVRSSVRLMVHSPCSSRPMWQVKMGRELAARLLEQYHGIGLTPPDWSWRYPPSIPFVGANYREGGVLVYGSAENLSHYVRNPRKVPPFMKDERVRDRHWAAYSRRSNDSRFFPCIHLQPASDGDLLVLAQYFLSKYGSPTVTYTDPRELLNRLAVANFSKFSIRGTTDRNIAGQVTKLRPSLPFVSADLAVLKPIVIIMPRSNWKLSAVSQAVRSAAPQARIIALPQCTPSVVNIHLKRHANRAESLRLSLQRSPIAEWIERIPDYGKRYFYRFLVELDEEMLTVRI